jgi:hypothetical protein
MTRRAIPQAEPGNEKIDLYTKPADIGDGL